MQCKSNGLTIASPVCENNWCEIWLMVEKCKCKLTLDNKENIEEGHHLYLKKKRERERVSQSEKCIRSRKMLKMPTQSGNSN